MGKFFLKTFFTPAVYVQNDQRATGIILRYVCWGIRGPPPPPGTPVADRPNPPPPPDPQKFSHPVGCQDSNRPPPLAVPLSSSFYGPHEHPAMHLPPNCTAKILFQKAGERFAVHLPPTPSWLPLAALESVSWRTRQPVWGLHGVICKCPLDTRALEVAGCEGRPSPDPHKQGGEGAGSSWAVKFAWEIWCF